MPPGDTTSDALGKNGSCDRLGAFGLVAGEGAVTVPGRTASVIFCTSFLASSAGGRLKLNGAKPISDDGIPEICSTLTV